MPAQLSEDHLELGQVFQCIRSLKDGCRDEGIYRKQTLAIGSLCGSNSPLPSLYYKWKCQDGILISSKNYNKPTKPILAQDVDVKTSPPSDSADTSLIGNPLELEQIADYELIEDQLIESEATPHTVSRRKRKKGLTLSPLPADIARSLISDLTLEFGDPLPNVWCVSADPTNQRLVLLGLDSEFIHTVEYKETCKPGLDINLETLLLTHKRFSPHSQIITEARCRYELTRLSAGGGNSVTPDDSPAQLTSSSVTIESCWTEVTHTLCNPPSNALADLNIHVVSGQTNSSVYHLYEQLTFLQCLADSMKSGEIHWKETILNEKSITERVEQMLYSPHHIHSSNSADPPMEMEGDLKSSSDVQLCIIEQRNNLDFGDQLWDLLTDCQTYTELVQSFQLICDAVNRDSVPPLMVMSNNKNSLSRWIYSRQNPLTRDVPPAIEFGGLHALFVLVEVGLERLERDYIHAFMYGFSGLVSADIIESMMSHRHTVTERLHMLHQLHTVLELAALMNGFLHLPSSLIKQTSKSSLDKMRSRDPKTHVSLDNKFKLTLPVSCLSNLLQMHTPDIWELYISSSVGTLETRVRITREEPEHHLPVLQTQRRPSGSLSSTECIENTDPFYCLQTVSTKIENL